MSFTADAADVDSTMNDPSLWDSAASVVVPAIDSLFELRSQCEPGKRDCEFWQWVAIAACGELCPVPDEYFTAASPENLWRIAVGFLDARRTSYMDDSSAEAIADRFHDSQAAIGGEINLFLQRVFNGGTMPTTKPRPNRQDRPGAERPKLMTLEDDEPDDSDDESKQNGSKFDAIKSSEFAALKRNGKSRPKVLQPVARQPMDLPLASIIDSPFQTREEPSDESIEQLAASLAKDGQRDPIRVREVGFKYELIAGHRRTRAARHLHWDVIVGVIVSIDDAQAAFEVYDDNEQREGLNQIERAKALKVIWEQYQAAGKSMDQMAVDVGLDQSTISNRLRLLAAPPSLQDRLISGEITESRLRGLATWAKYDGVLPAFESELLMRSRTGPVSNDHWNSALRIAIERNSRPVTRGTYAMNGDPLFDCSKYADELNIVEVKLDDHRGPSKRAFNVKRWKQLQAEAQKKRKAKEEKKTANATEDPSASKKRTDRDSWSFRNAHNESWGDPLWEAIGEKITGKLTNPQKIVAARLPMFLDNMMLPDEVLAKSLTMSDLEFAEQIIAHMKSEWQYGPYDLAPKQLLSIATYFGIDVSSAWRPTERLLQVCELLDLQDFASELNIDTSLNGHALIEMLVECWTPGWVPDLFALVPPKAAKKAKSKK